MLIEFSFKNWKSFRDETVFSAVTGSQNGFKERVPHIKKYRMGVTPVSSMYGGNAAGKSNFVDAIAFVRWFVIEQRNKDSIIPISPFLLDESRDKPVEFEITMLVKDSGKEELIYTLSFVVSRSEVLKEHLILETSSGEYTLYSRDSNGVKLGDKISKRNKDKLDFIRTMCRKDELFLSSVDRFNIDEFAPVYAWFKSLIVVTPSSKANLFEVIKGNFYDEGFNNVLSSLDTSIEKLKETEITEDRLDLAELGFIDLITRDIPRGSSIVLPLEGRDLIRVKRCESGELKYYRIESCHATADGEDMSMPLAYNSDGTKRIIEILPFLLMLMPADSRKVVIVDELDRSLHTRLVQELVGFFLRRCSKETRSQLIYTTHSLEGLSQGVFRRDELWLAERGNDNSSTLTRVDEFRDLRSDKDIHKFYLQGRMGGVPLISLDSIDPIDDLEVN